MKLRNIMYRPSDTFDSYPYMHVIVDGYKFKIRGRDVRILHQLFTAVQHGFEDRYERLIEELFEAEVKN